MSETPRTDALIAWINNDVVYKAPEQLGACQIGYIHRLTELAAELERELNAASKCPICDQVYVEVNARNAVIQECIAVARNVAAPFASPTAQEIITTLEALLYAPAPFPENATAK